ncbi:DNA polymerase IV [Nitrospira sp. KM1]|uniref:DNA polymerase Y family protein n=1 Tax=Nitrospira sp. KM1 TaxID=1936990 RepID=UPI0013A710DC|nr:DNA polymerase IV [Nitrospira sp. KM1]BCA55148.1 DNA polymerase IV [Nitrospira sp. KM1]
MRWARQVLFGDIDAMYASAAVVKEPALAGKPVAVGGPSPRGIILAASYPVRAFGVRSAMPTAEALRLCPNLILIPPDRPLYRRLHDEMRMVTDRLFPVTEWSSIDEFYAETTDLQSLYPDPQVLGQLTKHTLQQATGLRCTIGIASGKTVAKIAADSHKPDGLLVIEPGNEASFLSRLPVRSLPGIGPKTGALLDRAGIQRLGDLLDARWHTFLLRHLGNRLYAIQELLHGHDPDPVFADRESKSLSHETTFDLDTADPGYLEDVLRGFLRSLARDLRQDFTAANTFTVKLKDSRFIITTKQRSFASPLNYDPEMWPAIRQALHDLMQSDMTYRLVGLSLTSLTPAAQGLFNQRRAKAIHVMDALTAKHGPQIIGLGGVAAEEEDM